VGFSRPTHHSKEELRAAAGIGRIHIIPPGVIEGVESVSPELNVEALIQAHE
jgi:hypothetical protein